MTLQPFLASTPAIQMHVAAALLALAVGLGQFALRRGSPLHRAVGWLWILLLGITALTSFFIHEIRMLGLWSPIHLLSLLTLAMLVLGVRAIRRHDIRTHRYTMMSLFFFALIGAGGFTLIPGRMMHTVLFGG